MSRSSAAKLKKIDSIIKKNGLDLTGRTVLTELGSNDFLFLPIIAALAGAASVRAWVKDTKFGLASGVHSDFKELCSDNNLDLPVIVRENIRCYQDISEAHIITNSYMLRPLDEDFIEHIRPEQSTISLMYETWEFRTEDVCLAACKRREVPVYGTWEGHPDLNVFEFVGALAVKMALNAGFEVTGNRILVWSSDSFGAVSSDYFRRLNAEEVLLSNDWDVVKSKIQNFDFVFVCDCHEVRKYFDNSRLMPLEELKEINPSLGIVHLYGDIDSQFVIDAGFDLYPICDGRAETMSYTLAEVGCLPLFKLYSAGLKVGEEVLRGVPSSLCQVL